MKNKVETITLENKNTLVPDKWGQYFEYFHNFLLGKVKVNHIDDLIQETFEGALKTKDSFKGNSTERTWLTSILKRKLVDYYRKTGTFKAKSIINIPDLLETDFADFECYSKEDFTKNEGLIRFVKKAAEEVLSARDGEIFLKLTLEGYSKDSILDNYELTESAYWVILSRSRQKLKGCLNKHWF